MIESNIILSISEGKAKLDAVEQYCKTLESYLDNVSNMRNSEYYVAKKHLNACYDYLTENESDTKDIKKPSSRSSFRKLNISQEELEEKLRNLSYQNLADDKLKGALMYIADEVGTAPYTLEKYYDSIKTAEDREEFLTTTKSELDLIIKLEKSSLNIQDFLPSTIAQEILKLTSKVKVSPEACLTALITAISTCCKVGTQLEINLEQGFIVSPYQFAMIVAESGSMKSFIYDTFAKDPLAAIQKTVTDGWKRSKAQNEEELSRYDSMDAEERKNEYPEGRPQIADRPKVLHVGEKTMEGILTQFDLYPDQPIAYMKDELAGLFLDADKYSKGKGGESKSLMSMHGGTAPPVLRKEGGLVSNPGKVGLNIFGTIQPEVLQDFWSSVIDPDGYWSRFLYCYQPKTRKEIALKRYGKASKLPQLLENLFRSVYALPPVSYKLCDEGYETYAVFYNFLGDQGYEAVHPAMSKAYSKALGLTGRLILMLHIIDQVWRGEKLMPTEIIPVETVMKGINLMEFYLEQRKLLMKKLCNNYSISPELKAILDASKRLGWITARMAKRHIWQFKDVDSNTIRSWFQELVEIGYGEIQGKGNRLKYSAKTEKH